MSDLLTSFKTALKEGDPDALAAVTATQVDALSESDREELSKALGFASGCVVFHRPQYREVIERAVALGIHCNLWVAARAGLLEQVRALLDEDPSLLNREDSKGRTALQRAALVYGACPPCEEVADFLMKAGAEVDIFTASTFGMLDTVKTWLEQDASLVKARCQGSTSLNWAVRPRRSPEHAASICAVLLEQGADVHDPDADESDMTPLHHAAEWGGKHAMAIVDVLLGAGADLTRKDTQGWTSLEYARDRGRDEMVAFLEKKQAN